MKVAILTVCFLAFLFSFSTAALAADFTVNVTTDQHDAVTADGICDFDTATAGAQCSLRAAIEQANALVSNDRVLFSLPPNSTITLTNVVGEIPITNNGTLEILGTGANNLTVDGAGTSRIFYINSATVTISGVTLTRGNGNGAGFNSSVGGAILVISGSLTLNRVHITGNTSTESGGGLYIDGGTNHRFQNSTFSNNRSLANSGGAFLTTGTLTIVNTTISGNIANRFGGGFMSVFAAGSTTLRNVTVVNNTAQADSGGGIAVTDNAVLNFGNSIIAGNTNSNTPEIFLGFGGTGTSAGGNLIGDSAGDSAATGIAITYQASDKQNVNPLLGELTINNGGTTPTHALLAGSPAIDMGVNSLATTAGLTTDQRGTGYPRIVDGNNDTVATVDIGAFELQAAPNGGQGFEADIAPRPNGDTNILPDDVVQIRRFVNRTDTINSGTNEFQRADSAPFATKGDGVLDSADVVQTRRYANGSDPKQTAAGQTQPNNSTQPQNRTSEAKQSSAVNVKSSPEGGRELRVQNATGSTGGQVTVNLLVDAVGDESVYGFILGYDSAVLSNPQIGSGTAGAAILDCNTGTSGQVNCVVEGFPTNNPSSSNTGIREISAGNNQILLTVTFTIAANASAGTTPLTLTNVNASNDAAVRVTITSQNGTVTILAPTAALSEINGRVITAAGRGVSRARITITDQNGETKSVITNSFGYYRFTDIGSGETYTISAEHKQYSFETKVITVNENISELDFIAL